jgi:hypothetical protein
LILPTKGIPPNKALVTIGAEILRRLDEPRTVSRLWNDYAAMDAEREVTFDWFVLALDLLYMLGTVEMRNGLIERRTPSAGGRA